MLANHKKILITTGGLSSVGQTGGVSAYSHDLATNLANAGYDITVYLIRENNNIPPVNVNYNWALYNISETYKGEELTIIKLLADINSLQPEVIINNNTSYIAGLWPVINSKIVKISVMHGFARKYTLTNFGIIGKMAAVNQEYVDHIVCQNSRMVTDAIKKYKLPKEKVIFIPQTFKDPGYNNIHNNQHIKIIFANGLNVNKGADIMKNIAKLLMGTTLKFVFKWCLMPEKHSLLLDNRFETFGGLNRNDFLDKLRLSDIIIVPTKLDTGPMLVVEALANGVVPICNNLEESAIPDLINDGENGFRIKDNSPIDYVNVIKRLDSDRDLLHSVKEKGKKFFLNNLTDQHQVERYRKIFGKNSTSPSTQLSNRNFIYYHLKKTSHLSKLSHRRIYLKIRYALEVPLYK